MTLVGLVIALILTGSAQQITGLATIITLIIWLLTIDLENNVFDSVILDDIDDEIDSHCRTFLHPNGYTNVSICNCKYPSI